MAKDNLKEQNDLREIDACKTALVNDLPLLCADGVTRKENELATYKEGLAKKYLTAGKRAPAGDFQNRINEAVVRKMM